VAKYRQNKVKRQHHVLADLEDGLKTLASLPAVDGIIPGIIRPKSGGSLGFTFQYLTQSGFKLIGRSSAAAQEIFVISRDPQTALLTLYQLGLLADRPDLRPPHP
jgi:hypothetical protein